MKKITKIITRNLLLCMLLPFSVNAQLAVNGKVVDATSNEPLIGVGIVVKQAPGKSIIAATSDITGSFKLTLPESSGTLQVSYVGYKTQSIEVTSANAVDLVIKLAEDIGKLDEVIVTGLATNVKRSNLANNVATISSKQLTEIAGAQTVDAALSGKIPGASIVANSGAPGGGVSIKMRGITTINAASQPLFVVDGVFVDNSATFSGLNLITAAVRGTNQLNSTQDNPSSRIADLNPNDIENVEILKGASAAAIYGSQAAAGVVVITTKRGKTGTTRIGLSQDIGFTTVSKLVGVRRYDEQKAFETFGNTGLDLFKKAQASGKIYDYEKELYGNTGLLSTARINASGGNERTTFYLAGSVRNDEAIIKNTGYKNNSIRANIDHKINDRVSLLYSGNFINISNDRGLTNNDNNSVTFGVSLSATPEFVDLHPDATGIYPANPFAPSNVLQTRDKVINNEKINRFLNGASLRIYLHQAENTYTRLSLNSGFDYYNSSTFAYFPRFLQFQSGGAGTNGASIQGNTYNFNTNSSAFLVNNYNANGGRINFTTTLGATYETFNRNALLTAATQLIGTQTGIDQAGSVKGQQIRLERRDNGFFVQEEVNFSDMVILTAGVRLDRSTNNGDVEKYNAYPKVSAAWNVSKIGSLKDIKSIDNLKLRIAYGQAGNVPVFGSKYTALASANISGLPGSLIQGAMGNAAITPERQAELEFGVDLSVLEGRLSFDATYYIKTITDLILQRNLPASTGFVTQWTNAGSLENRGFELGVNISPVRTENFKWDSRINFWNNQSKVTKLSIPAFRVGAFSNAYGIFYIEEGKSPRQIVGLTGGENNEVGVLGNADPKFQVGFTNEFTIYKNFTLSAIVHWKNGGQNINLSTLLADYGGTSPDYDEDKDGNGKKDALDRMSANSAKPFVQDASYVRIREIGLYYNFPAASLSKIYLKGLRLGVSANNYFTFTDYVGYDPEVSNFGTDGVSTGVDVMPYPSSKRMMFHLAVEF